MSLLGRIRPVVDLALSDRNQHDLAASRRRGEQLGTPLFLCVLGIPLFGRLRDAQLTCALFLEQSPIFLDLADLFDHPPPT